MPRGVLVDPKAEVKQEYYAGVVWDGLRKQPVMIFSPVGGIDIEQVAEEQPDKVGRRHFSTIEPFSDYMAKEVIASTGVTGRAAHAHHPHPRPAGAAVRGLRHDARGDQPARRARGRLVRRARRAHGHGERGPAAPEGAPEGARRGRRGDARGARADRVRAGRRGGRLDGPPRRGRQRDRVRRRPRPRDRRRRRLADALRRRARPRRPAGELLRDRRQPVGPQGRRPGEARAPEAGRGQDRRDDVDRLQHPRGHRRPRRDQGLPRARLRPGREDRHLPHPGRLGGGGLQDPREVRRGVLRPLGVDARGRAARGARRSRERRREHPHRREHHLHRPGHHRPRGGEPHARVPRLREGRPGGGRRHAGPEGPRRARRAGVRHRRAGGRAPRRADQGLGRDRPARLHQGRRVRGDRERHRADRDRDRADPARRRRADGRARGRRAARASSGRTASGSSCPT